MNKSILYVFTFLSLYLFTACQSKTEGQPAGQPTDSIAAKPSKAQPQHQTMTYRSANKGKILARREIPVYSRIAEQIVMFGIKNIGEYVKKGQVVARLNDDALRVKISHSRAKLEKAEFQYQAILMDRATSTTGWTKPPTTSRNWHASTAVITRQKPSCMSWSTNCHIIPSLRPFRDMS